MIAQFLEQLSDPNLSQRLAEHAAALTAAAKEHRDSEAALVDTKNALSSLRNEIELREAGVIAREVALQRREVDLANAERQARETQAGLDKQRQELAEKAVDIESRVRQGAAADEKLVRLKGEVQALMNQLGLSK
jgi:hypothetical protein